MKRWAARERSKNRGKVRSLKRGGGGAFGEKRRQTAK